MSDSNIIEIAWERELRNRDTRDHFVYIIGRLEGARVVGPTKIGISHSPDQRIKQLQSMERDKLVLVGEFGFWKRAHARAVEKAFHATCDIWRDYGEWFDMPPVDAVSLMSRCLGEFVQYVLQPRDRNEWLSAYDHINPPGYSKRSLTDRDSFFREVPFQ